MSDSYLVANKAGQLTTYVGNDATALFAAIALRSAIRMYVKCGIKASRMYTPTNMRHAASRLTGKAYKQSELAKAGEDLTAWIDAMRSALPVVSEA